MPRGRKSQGAGDVFTIRITADLRSRLQRVADGKSGSLNNEIRRRLERSFDDDKKINERFGDLRTFAFFRLLHLVVEVVGSGRYGTARSKFWLDDRYQYLQVATAIQTLLDAIEPAGPKAPKDESPPESVGILIAEHVFGSIKAANPSARTALPAILQDALESAFPAEVEAGIYAQLEKHLDRAPDNFFMSAFRRQVLAGRKRQ